MTDYIPMQINVRDFFSVEQDCLSGSFSFSEDDSVEKITYLIWKNCALLGEVILPEEIENNLFEQARKYFARLMSNPNCQFNILEEKILVLAVVYLSQKNTQQSNAEQDHTWEYVFNRLQDEKLPITVAHQILYKRFCKFFKTALEEHHRFFTMRGKKYYNSLMIHAIMPEWSTTHLLNILFSFYSKTLNYQYIPDDTSFHRLVDTITSRWCGDQTNSEEVLAEILPDLRSDSLASSHKQLFENRPHYMAAMCSAIVEKMDCLLKGNTLPAINDRWNLAIQQWFEAKSTYERQKLQGDKCRRKQEKTVTEQSRIVATYIYQNDTIFVQLPQIRLPEITKRPILKVFQGDRILHQETMSVFGNSICYTTYAVQYALSQDSIIDWNKDLSFSLEIHCEEVCLYHSHNTLYRSYLAFDHSGAEIQLSANMTEDIWLFTGNNAIVDIHDDSDNYYQANHPGQLYRISLATAQMVLVSSINILETAHKNNNFSIYFSNRPKFDVNVQFDGQNYMVFSEPTNIVVRLADNNSQMYRVILDGIQYSLSQFGNQSKEYIIPLPKAVRYCHAVVLKDFSSGKSLLSYNYIILPEFSYTLDRSFYWNIQGSGFAKIRIGGTVTTYPFELEIDQKEVSFPLWQDLRCVLSIPKVSATVASQNALSLPSHIWHEELDSGGFLTVERPTQLIVLPYINGEPLSPMAGKANVFEVRNSIYSKTNWDTAPTVTLRVLEKGILKEERTLTTVVMDACFLTSPLQIDGRAITWQPDAAFYGKADSKFSLRIENDQQSTPWEYPPLSLKKYNVERNFNCIDGTYAYQVVLLGSSSLFSALPDRVIFDGSFTVGDPEKGKFARNQIILTHAHYWSPQTGKDEISRIRQNRAILSDITYEGISAPDGFEVNYPEYEAYLQFKTSDGRFCDFNSNLYNKKYLPINPVRFWIVENQLFVKAVDGELLLANTRSLQQYGNVQLVNSLQDFTKEEQRRYCPIIDSFAFEVRKEIES